MNKGKKKNNKIETSQLPASYDISVLTLIARDPHWIYAYWEMATSDVEKFMAKYGDKSINAQIILRIYDVTCRDFDGTNANHSFDIVVGAEAKNWYINLWNDNATYCAEIGWLFDDGEFYPLKRSNFITTHRACAGAQNDVVWMEVSKDQTQNNKFIASQSYRSLNCSAMNSGFGEKVFTPKGTKTQHTTTGILKKPSTKRRPLSVEEIKAYYLGLSPLLKNVKTFTKPKIVIQEDVNSELESVLSDDFQITTLKSQKSFKQKFIGSSRVWEFESKTDGDVRSFFESQDNFIGASEEFWVQEKQETQKDFYFEIGTELIVYGRTEPDAKVTCGGQNVSLRDDGTFSMRFSLPEGNVPLDFIAKSIEKNLQRSIATQVVRNKTIYNP